jgi:hypothetical protein
MLPVLMQPLSAAGVTLGAVQHIWQLHVQPFPRQLQAFLAMLPCRKTLVNVPPWLNRESPAATTAGVYMYPAAHDTMQCTLLLGAFNACHSSWVDNQGSGLSVQMLHGAPHH